MTSHCPSSSRGSALQRDGDLAAGLSRLRTQGTQTSGRLYVFSNVFLLPFLSLPLLVKCLGSVPRLSSFWLCWTVLERSLSSQERRILVQAPRRTSPRSLRERPTAGAPQVALAWASSTRTRSGWAPSLWGAIVVDRWRAGRCYPARNSRASSPRYSAYALPPCGVQS